MDVAVDVNVVMLVVFDFRAWRCVSVIIFHGYLIVDRLDLDVRFTSIRRVTLGCSF